MLTFSQRSEDFVQLERRSLSSLSLKQWESYLGKVKTINEAMEGITFSNCSSTSEQHPYITIDHLQDPSIACGNCRKATNEIRKRFPELIRLDLHSTQSPFRHSALYIEREDVVIDYTFNQFSTLSTWPLITSYSDWVDKVCYFSGERYIRTLEGDARMLVDDPADSN